MKHWLSILIAFFKRTFLFDGTLIRAHVHAHSKRSIAHVRYSNKHPLHRAHFGTFRPCKPFHLHKPHSPLQLFLLRREVLS